MSDNNNKMSSIAKDAGFDELIKLNLVVGPFISKEYLSFDSVFKSSPRIFSPIVQSVYNEHENTLITEAKLFIRIPKQMELSDGSPDICFCVYKKNKWKGVSYCPSFMICYDCDRDDLSDNFAVYSLTFTIEDVYVQPLKIKTYLLDVDPDGSRGTETTVQSGG